MDWKRAAHSKTLVLEKMTDRPRRSEQRMMAKIKLKRSFVVLLSIANDHYSTMGEF